MCCRENENTKNVFQHELKDIVCLKNVYFPISYMFQGYQIHPIGLPGPPSRVARFADFHSLGLIFQLFPVYSLFKNQYKGTLLEKMSTYRLGLPGQPNRVARSIQQGCQICVFCGFGLIFQLILVLLANIYIKLKDKSIISAYVFVWYFMILQQSYNFTIARSGSGNTGKYEILRNVHVFGKTM